MEIETYNKPDGLDYYSVNRFSQSNAKLILNSIDTYLKNGKKTTSAMIAGNALHTWLLERDKFDSRYILQPEDMKLTNSVKDSRVKPFLERVQNENLQIIKHSDYQFWEFWEHEIAIHPLSPEVLSGEKVEFESEIYFDYQGIACKCKLDILNHSKELVGDYKTIADCSKAESTARYEHSMQAYVYQYAVNYKYGYKPEMIWIYLEKAFPNGIKFIKFSDETLDFGRQQWEKAISILTNYRTGLELEFEQYTGYSENFIIV